MSNYDNEGFDDTEVQEEFIRQMTSAHLGFCAVGVVFMAYQLVSLF